MSDEKVPLEASPPKAPATHHNPRRYDVPPEEQNRDAFFESVKQRYSIDIAEADNSDTSLRSWVSKSIETLAENDVRKLCVDLFVKLMSLRDVDHTAVAHEEERRISGLEAFEGVTSITVTEDQDVSKHDSFADSKTSPKKIKKNLGLPLINPVYNSPLERSVDPLPVRPVTPKDADDDPLSSTKEEGRGSGEKRVQRINLARTRPICAKLIDEFAEALTSGTAVEDDTGLTTVQDYILDELIGFGSQGSVYQGWRASDGLRVAIKQVRLDHFLRRMSQMKNNTSIAHVEDESYRNALKSKSHGELPQGMENITAATLHLVATLKHVRHKNVASIYDAIVDLGDNYVYLVMQFIDGEDVLQKNTGSAAEDSSRASPLVLPQAYKGQKIYNPLSETKAAKYLFHIACALSYLHARHVIHRDVKPTNIMVERETDVAYLVDFGVSELCANSAQCMLGFAGTPFFMAPEVLQSDPLVSSAADVWALGVTAFVMLTGSLPFVGATREEFVQKVQSGDVPHPPEISDSLYKLIQNMLAKDREKRPSAHDVAMQLSPLCGGEGADDSCKTPENQDTINVNSETLRVMLPGAIKWENVEPPKRD